jgi:hypothetical protein
LSEILFGLIMVLTFTGSLSVATAAHGDVREMLVGALGCNFAWGVIDAIMYLMATLSDRARDYRTVHAVRDADTADEAHDAIVRYLPAVVARTLGPEELERIRKELNDLPNLPRRAGLTGQDWRGALGVFLLVFTSTLPVALPFAFFQDVAFAMRVSNLIAIVMLAVIGYAYGRNTGYTAFGMAAGMVALGVVLVAFTIALGG